MAENVKVNVGGTYKELDKGYVNIGGTWKELDKIWVNIGGVWKEVGLELILSYYGTATALSTQRRMLRGESFNDFAIMAGGQYGTSAYYDILELYNSTLTKTTGTPLVVGRSSISSGVIPGYVVFSTGTNGSAVGYIDAFNTSFTRTYLTATGRYHTASAATTDKVFFAGGFDGSSYRTDVDMVDTNLTRTTVTSLTYGTIYFNGASVGNYAIVAGGNASPSGPTNAMYHYNNNGVRGTGTLSESKRSLAGVTTPNYAVFGGGYGTARTSVVEGYNSSLVRSILGNLSTPTVNCQGSYIGGYTLFIGGNTASGDSSVVDVFDQSFVRLSPQSISVGRTEMGIANVGNYCLIAGGLSGGVHLNSVEVFQVS